MKFSIKLCLFLSVKIANNAGLDEISLYAAFHPDLHCLFNCMFTRTQNENS